MVTSHYSHKVMAYLKIENLDFVEKSQDAPNVPQARDIERFWALCKAEYPKLSKPLKSLRKIATRWRIISRKVAETSGKAVMDSTFKTIRNIGYKGVAGSGVV